MIYLAYLNARAAATADCIVDAMKLMGKGGVDIATGTVVLLVSLLAIPLVPVTAAFHYMNHTGE